jgi:hypothetical protein
MIVVIFLSVAILLLATTVLLAVSTGRRLAHEIRVRGYVVDLVMRRDQVGSEFYYPVVTFTLPDGSPRTVQLAEGSWPPAHEIDEAVTVAYDPHQPLDARISSDGSPLRMWIGPLITGVVGLAFLGATLLARWILKPSPMQVQGE